MTELKNSNEQQRKELQELKLRHKDELLNIEKEKNELLLENKELEYKLKQQRLILESEKLEIVSQKQKLEADKIASEQALKSYENNISYTQSLQQFQIDSKIADFQREIEIQKEQHRNELLKARQESDKTVLELKILYEKEKDAFKGQISQLQSKLRIYSQEIEHLKQECNQNMLKIQIEELESELDYYKSLSINKFKEETYENEDFRSLCTDNLESYRKSSRSARSGLEEEIENLTFQKEQMLIQLINERKNSENLRDDYEKLKTEINV